MYRETWISLHRPYTIFPKWIFSPLPTFLNDNNFIMKKKQQKQKPVTAGQWKNRTKDKLGRINTLPILKGKQKLYNHTSNQIPHSIGINGKRNAIEQKPMHRNNKTILRGELVFKIFCSNYRNNYSQTDKTKCLEHLPNLLPITRRQDFRLCLERTTKR